MSKCWETFGVDISKEVFDVHGSTTGHHQHKNDGPGFKKFHKKLPSDCLVAMEATDHYQYRLAQFFYKNTVVVSVINPFNNKAFYTDEIIKNKNR
jgi:transposase